MSNERVDGGERVEARSGLTHHAIRAQLSRVLASRDFGATERTASLLRFLVEEALEDRADQLKGYTIAVEVFGRGEDFDPAKDPVVRTQAGRLRQALERYYLLEGKDDPIRIEIPRGRYVPLFVEVSSVGPVGPRVPEIPRLAPAIAVLPPVALGEPEAVGWFAGGLGEELLIELNRYQDFVAVPCRSSVAEPASLAEWSELADAMQARFFLGGSVRRDSEIVKAAVHVVDSSEGTQIWSRTFKVPLEARELIAIQETIAREVIAIVADQLGVVAKALSREANRKPPSEWKTFEAMLHYHHALALLDEHELMVSQSALESALESEPDYGPAWAALGNLWLQGYAFSGIDEVSAFEQASEWIERGAELDPDNQLARTARAFLLLLRGDLPGFEREAQLALELNPGSPFYVGMLGYLTASSGEFARGLEMLDWAISVSARHPNWFHHIMFMDHWKRAEFEEAAAELMLPARRSWELALRGCALHRLGREQEARELFENAVSRESGFRDRARHVLGGLWRDEEMASEIAEIFRQYGVDV